MARSMPSRISRRNAGRRWRAFASAMARYVIIISAEEPLMPPPTGSVLANATSTPARRADRPKLPTSLPAMVMG